MKATGGTVFKRHTSALDRPGGTLSLRPSHVGLSLRYLWVRVSTAIGHLWLGIAIVAQAVVLSLRYLWVKVSTVLGHLLSGIAALAQSVTLVLGYASRGVVAAADAVGRTLRHLWMRVSSALGHLGLGVALVAQAVGLALRYVWMGVSSALSHLWRGVAAAAQAAALAMWYLWRGVAIVAQVIGLALRYVWMGVSSVLGDLWRGVALVAQVIGLALRYVWMGVSAALGYLGLGVSSIVRPLRLGTSTILRYIWLGVLTTALALGWALHHMWQGILIILQALRRTPGFVVRTVWTAFAASPDVLRAVVWVVKHRKGVSTMSDHNLTRERLLSLVVTVLVFFTIASIGVRIFWPAPPEPKVVVTHWVTGHLYFGPDLPGTAAKFNDTGPRTKSGKSIVVEIYNAPSSEGARDLLSRVTDRGARPARPRWQEATAPGPHHRDPLRRPLASARQSRGGLHGSQPRRCS